MIAKLCSQHQQLRQMGRELLALVDRPEPCDRLVLASRRWQLARKILQHLVLEERCVNGPLERSARPKISILAASMKVELEAGHAGFEQHLARWTPEAIESDWNGYRTAVRHLVDFMFDRMDREEAELYPLVNPHADIAARSPGDRNWAADGWAMREKIECAA